MVISFKIQTVISTAFDFWEHKTGTRAFIILRDNMTAPATTRAAEYRDDSWFAPN